LAHLRERLLRNYDGTGARIGFDRRGFNHRGLPASIKAGKYHSKAIRTNGAGNDGTMPR
jgi:hypothetical protein